VPFHWIPIAIAYPVIAALISACGDDLTAAEPDGGGPDAGAEDRERLSGLGLYRDIASKEIAPGAREFEPDHALWSDGSVKRRWIVLPEGAVIDTSDMDRWRVPVGTRLFKEFAIDGRRIETRLIERTGPAAADFDMVAYLWLEDESDAVRTPEGLDNALETDHDVPGDELCLRCHRGERGRVLGFSALQLDHDGALSVASLAAEGLLSDPPATDAVLRAPGGLVERAALGALHANCGHCHNPFGTAWPDTELELRLAVADRQPEDTTTYKTAVGEPLNQFRADGYELRIDPGSPETSAVLHRMEDRGSRVQMPPIATEKVDEDGVAAVTAWIEVLGGTKE
jgi:hypothetical protein